MDLFDWPLKFIIAFALGAVIGLEREINEQKNLKGDNKGKHAILGLRSFALTSGLGAITGALYGSFPIMAAILSVTFFLLLLTFYFFDTKLSNDPGITTETAVIYSYILGFLVFTNLLPMQLIVAITVVLVLLTSRKEDIKEFITNIKKQEINALISFAILALVILPFLPNETYALSDFSGLKIFLDNVGWNAEKVVNLELFNPFKLWTIVVIITGVDLLGYILERTIGKNRGWLVASLVGGFVSSTATTISIAQESKRAKSISPLLSGAVFANAISFIPVILLLASFNPPLLVAAIPLIAVLFISAIIIGIFWQRTAAKEKKQKLEEKNPGESHSIFSLTSALKFVGIYLIINIVSKIALEFFGTGGFLATTALGSLTGIDAVVINTAQLAGTRIDITLALWALILANGINLLAKSVYAYLHGSREFAIKFLYSMLIVIAASIGVGILQTLLI